MCLWSSANHLIGMMLYLGVAMEIPTAEFWDEPMGRCQAETGDRSQGWSPKIGVKTIKEAIPKHSRPRQESFQHSSP